MVVINFHHCTDDGYGIVRLSKNSLVKKIIQNSPFDHDIEIATDFKTACVIIEFTYGADNVFPHIYTDLTGSKKYIVSGLNDIKEYVPPVVSVRY